MRIVLFLLSIPLAFSLLQAQDMDSSSPPELTKEASKALYDYFADPDADPDEDPLLALKNLASMLIIHREVLNQVIEKDATGLVPETVSEDVHYRALACTMLQVIALEQSLKFFDLPDEQAEDFNSESTRWVENYAGDTTWVETLEFMGLQDPETGEIHPLPYLQRQVSEITNSQEQIQENMLTLKDRMDTLRATLGCKTDEKVIKLLDALDPETMNIQKG